jgi:hypothetical protein
LFSNTGPIDYKKVQEETWYRNASKAVKVFGIDPDGKIFNTLSKIGDTKWEGICLPHSSFVRYSGPGLSTEERNSGISSCSYYLILSPQKGFGTEHPLSMLTELIGDSPKDWNFLAKLVMPNGEYVIPDEDSVEGENKKSFTVSLTNWNCQEAIQITTSTKYSNSIETSHDDFTERP